MVKGVLGRERGGAEEDLAPGENPVLLAENLVPKKEKAPDELVTSKKASPFWLSLYCFTSSCGEVVYRGL